MYIFIYKSDYIFALNIFSIRLLYSSIQKTGVRPEIFVFVIPGFNLSNPKIPGLKIGFGIVIPNAIADTIQDKMSQNS